MKPKFRTREEVYKEWLARLRSGQYNQGTGQLKRNVDGKERYCCLGVLQDIAVTDGGKPWTNSLMTSDEPETNIILYCGLRGDNILVLTRMNDNLRLSFNQIADFIENEIMPIALYNR